MLVWCLLGATVQAMEVPTGYRFKEEKLIPGYGKKIIFENREGRFVVKLVAEKAPPTQPSIGGRVNVAAKPSFPPPQQKILPKQPSIPQFAAVPVLPPKVVVLTPRTVTPPTQQIAKAAPRVEVKEPAPVALQLSGAREREVCAKRKMQYPRLVVAQSSDARLYSKAVLRGKASWYGHRFDGGPMRHGGDTFDMCDPRVVAMNNVPGGTIVEITNKANGKSGLFIVMDTGGFAKYGVTIDLSYGAAAMLDTIKEGKVDVAYRIVQLPKGKPKEAYAALGKPRKLG